MTDMRCTMCGNPSLEPGFILDAGQGAKGYARWVAGALEKGIFGGAKVMGRPKRRTEARRCTKCGHLELFATDPE
ncbi:hypothetical protein G5C51_28525 [Streptomyces sp. A7024]|uniref:Uncharacterized protein n=1 Tax=Streptomyces coryli TaxID=1128680 RepID=A0A6G4U6M8_9ACTN|nr:hypothetical protein [Streptomyces coryli]NGN67834.1 hypothetical protein [Streptomyces coryli]